MAARYRTRTLLAVLTGIGALALGGCASTTSPSGRARLVAPTEVSAVYSEVGLQTQLALSSEAYCSDKECLAVDAFRRQVQRLGYRLGNAAHEIAPELGLSPPGFIVTTPTKRDIGTLSSASGSLVVFDGLRQLELPEPALAFLIAREMGHIMGQHHEENSATNIAVSVVVALLFPVAGILQQGTTAAVSSTAAGLSAGVASTAISFAGSHVVKAMYRDEQVREADAYALQIMRKAGWTPEDVALALDAAGPRIAAGEGWLTELRTTKVRLDQIVMGPAWPLPAMDIPPVAAAPSPPGGASRSDWLHAVVRIGEPFKPEWDGQVEGEWMLAEDVCPDPGLSALAMLRSARGPSAFSETLNVSSAKRPGRLVVSRKATPLKMIAASKVVKKTAKRPLNLAKKGVAKKGAATRTRASARAPWVPAKASGIDGRRQIGL